MAIKGRIQAVMRSLFAAITFREARSSTKRGRNQLRIAAGLAMIAAAGFCLTKLIDPRIPTFDLWIGLYVASTITTIRVAGWLFLTIEGGEE